MAPTNQPLPAQLATFRQFFKLESSGGIFLFVAAVLAMVLKNSPLAGWYVDALTLPVQIRVGDLDLNKPLVLWVNDGLMAVFFLFTAVRFFKCRGCARRPQPVQVDAYGAGWDCTWPFSR